MIFFCHVKHFMGNLKIAVLNSNWNTRLLPLPIIDLLQQFEDYVKGIALRKIPPKNNNKKIRVLLKHMALSKFDLI